MIVKDFISFGTSRRAQMADYCRRHYGDPSILLDPRAVVLHYTAGGTYESAWSLFQSNVPNRDEKPGTVAHFIVDKDGTIYQLLSLDLMGRHAIGLNHVSIGIEFVQESGAGDTWATGQILDRDQQARAGLELVRWLQARFGIKTRDVIGHAEADASRYFKDLEGWHNTHVDWGPQAAEKFRKALEDR